MLMEDQVTLVPNVSPGESNPDSNLPMALFEHLRASCERSSSACG